MLICDRCRKEHRSLRECHTGLWYDKLIFDECRSWTSTRGDEKKLTLCPKCFDMLLDKIAKTIQQDEVQPAYSLEAKSWWFTPFLAGAVGAAATWLGYLTVLWLR